VEAGRPLSGILAFKLRNADREKAGMSRLHLQFDVDDKMELVTPHSVETNTYPSKCLLVSAATALAPCQNTTLGTTREPNWDFKSSGSKDVFSECQDIEQI
jgi:hypothetical protein